MAGGKPVRISTESDLESVPDFDGLILGGGANIHPSLYEEEVIPDYDFRSVGIKLVEIFYYPFTLFFKYLGSNNKHDIDRDKLELKMLKVADERNLPVLGICRGLQLINVYFNGKLAQNYYGKLKGEFLVASFLPRKPIKLKPASQIYQLFGANKIYVNALHLQAVEKLGDNLIVSARETNGIVQAIEHQSKKILAVQWHPEYLIYKKSQRKIFRWLVDRS